MSVFVYTGRGGEIEKKPKLDFLIQSFICKFMNHIQIHILKPQNKVPFIDFESIFDGPKQCL